MAIDFKHATLPNGLQIIGEVDPSAHTAALGFFVKTGARDEDPAIMGVSHFLEHMMFKGTDTRTAEDVDRQFDAIGANHNAFTTSELTAFYAHTLPDRMEAAEEILSDIMRPAIRVDDFNDEKKVILEEIAMYQDQPFWVLYEQAMEVYYKAHPLSHRVLGTDDTINDLQRDAMSNYFEDRYSADNTVVAMAGRVDFEAMVDRLTEHCSGWSRTDATRTHQAADCKPESFSITSPTAHQQYLLMMSPAPAIGDDRRYAASMLAQVLGDVDGSRLYWALVETGLAEEAQAQYNGRDGLGEFLVYAVSSPDRAEQVESTIRREIDKLVDSLTEDDLARVSSKVATSLTLSGELPNGRMRRLGQVWTYLGQYRSLEDELARIQAVTLDDLREVAREYPMDQQVIGRLVPAPTN